MAESREHRGHLSNIDQLPEDIRVRVNTDLRERRLTQKDIRKKYNPELKERGLPILTRSSLSRYAAAATELESMRAEAMAVADKVMGKLGEETGQDLGHAITESVRTLSWHLVTQMTQDMENLDPDKLAKMALAVQRLENAGKATVEREQKIREEAERKAKEEAAAAMEEEADKIGLSLDARDKLREAMGIR